MKQTSVVNQYGKELDYEAAVMLMDDDLREELYAEAKHEAGQEFFDAYAQAHREKFGEEWELAKANPVW